MRLLHTADWHVGRTIRGRSRFAEFEAVLDEVIDIARRERVEAMLVCGDIWDRASPPPEADRLVYRTLRACHAHGIQVVLLAGNHDNPQRLRALGLLSDLVGVQTQAQVRPPHAGGVLTIQGREHEARIAAVPFITEGRHVDAVQVMGRREDWFGAYADSVAAVMRDMCSGFAPDTVNVLAAHIFVDGARVARVDGSERLLHIGQTYGVTAASLPATPQYVALGHVHEPQVIANAGAPTAYSGSLLQLDFGERGQQKVVRVLDVAPGLPARSEAIALASGRPLAELRGTYDEVLRQAEDAGDAHLRVRLEVEAPEPGLAERVREALPNAVDVRLDYERPEDEGDAEALGRLGADELFARYYRQQHGADPAPELVALFTALLAEADEAHAAETAGDPEAADASADAADAERAAVAVP